MDTPSHTAWVQAALEAHEQRLLRYAFRMTRNADLARDVVQDTFLRLCTADRSAIEDYLLPWLYRVCRNRALDVMKKEQRMEPMDDKQLARQPDPGPSMGKTLDNRDRVALVLRTLAELPEKQQEVFRLKFQEQLSYKEISEVTGFQVHNVRYLLHTALKRVRETLADQAEPVQAS
jgi:RNA polymerase sigma factor (sigma-70 family)